MKESSLKKLYQKDSTKTILASLISILIGNGEIDEPSVFLLFSKLFN